MMHKVFSCLALITASAAFTDDVLDLRPQLTEAANAQAADYVQLRNRLVAETKTNTLWSATSDSRLDWRERLVARIVLERKLRGPDIEALRTYNWFSDPEFNPEWLQKHSGVAGHMSPLAFRRFAEAGLWYYYIELNWKDTGERSSLERRGRALAPGWLFYAIGGLEGTPEYLYLPRVRMERISENSRFGSEDFSRNYGSFLKEKISDAVPVLVERFESYFNNKTPAREAFPGRRNQLFQGNFELLIQIADQRHVELLDAYITAHPVLEPLRKELDAVRQRPAPKPTLEPPFRVMPTPEFLKPKAPVDSSNPVSSKLNNV